MKTLKTVLADAYRRNYAVGAFNISNLEMIQAIIYTAKRFRSPVIIATSPKAIDYAGGPHILVSMVRELEKMTNVPIVLHLDHSKSYELVKQCITAGYTSVMFDGSRLTYADNVRITKRVVALARIHGVSVEAEIGIIGGQEDYLEKRNIFLADPATTFDFVKKTKIDALAAAVGTAHGLAFDISEKIDFALLQEITRRVKIPLVLHGASQGISDQHIKKAIKHGVAKINIDTDLRIGFAKSIRALLVRDKQVYDPRTILGVGRTGIEKVVETKMRLFSSINKVKR